MKDKNSFSILEVSLVLLIIAMIITMIISINKPSDTAKLDSIINEVKFYAKQSSKFEEIYGGLPGDLAKIDTLPNYNVGISVVAGNGNGIIDNNVESLNFWLCLKKANLITGNFNSSSTNTIYDPFAQLSSSTTAKVPSTKYPDGMISVDSTGTTKNLIFIISKESASYTTSISLLKPADARALDLRYDDGFPNTGMIRAFDGSDVASGSCVTNNQYSLSNNNIGCYLNIYTESKNINISNSSNCDGNPIGTTRISSTKQCPSGTWGNVFDSCTASGWIVGSLYFCENTNVYCSEELTNGQNINLQCTTGYVGSGIAQYTCNSYGILYPSSISNCSSSGSLSCGSSLNGVIRYLPCPVGYTGTWTQTCNGVTFTNNFNNCSNNPIKCGSQNIGDVINTSFLSNAPVCPGSFTPTSVKKLCSLPIIDPPPSSSPTFAPSGADYVIAEIVCPSYGGTCSSGVITTYNCPYGQTGSVTARCDGGVYKMISNTCQKTTCNGLAVGAWRIAQGLKCPYPLKGNVLEICDYTDSDKTNCSGRCSSAKWKTSFVACN